MASRLNADEFDALEQIGRGIKRKPVSAFIAQHTKHLYGLKYIASRRDGIPFITDAGKEALFFKHCTDGLRQLASDPNAKLSKDIMTLLEKKGHIKPAPDGGFMLMPKAIETLADLDAQS